MTDTFLPRRSDYFFRNGEYAAMADRQIKSNAYMDILGRKPVFRNAKSELDRRNIEVSVKRWIKKKHPSFDGDVYVEKSAVSSLGATRGCRVHPLACWCCSSIVD